MGEIMLKGIFNFWDSLRLKFKSNKEAKKYAGNDKPLTPDAAKAKATANKEPYIAVLQTHVNPDNVRNGFFELDWNEFFVLQLTNAGYQGTSEEDIVNQWFQELCKGIADEEDISMDNRPMGYINVKPIAGGKAEVS
jgi:hypothetical protein